MWHAPATLTSRAPDHAWPLRGRVCTCWSELEWGQLEGKRGEQVGLPDEVSLLKKDYDYVLFHHRTGP